MHDRVVFSRKSNVGSHDTNTAEDVDSCVRRSVRICNARSGRRLAI